MENLESLRAQIRAKDEEILRTIAERLELAKKIGTIKMQQKLPIKDDKHEKGVLEHARATAKKLGLYTQRAEQTATLLMRYGVIAQDEDQSRAKARTTRKVEHITIVGGSGRMGKWHENFFGQMGHKVTVSDQNADLTAAVACATVIVLTTPISVTANVIDALTALGSKALIFDICSLKSPLLDAINRAKAKGLRIGSVHPMFGPDVEFLAGKNVIICDSGDPSVTDQCYGLFSESTATILRLPLAEHDRLMGQVLGHSHLCSLVFNRGMEKSGIPFTDLHAVASTTFAAQLNVARTVAGENPDLYYEIQQANRSTGQMIAGVREALAEYESAIATGDRAKFIALMTAGKSYLGR